MKNQIIGVALTLAIGGGAAAIAPAIASASTWRNCKITRHYAVLEFGLKEKGTTCSTARSVQKWFNSNEFAGAHPRIAGRIWTGTIYSRKYGWTWFRATAGRAVVKYVTGAAVS